MQVETSKLNDYKPLKVLWTDELKAIIDGTADEIFARLPVCQGPFEIMSDQSEGGLMACSTVTKDGLVGPF